MRRSLQRIYHHIIISKHLVCYLFIHTQVIKFCLLYPSLPVQASHQIDVSYIKLFHSALEPCYSATSIIWISFIRALDYPDQLEIRKYITTHAQKAQPMIFCGYGHRLSDELRTLQTCLGQNCLTRLLFLTLLAMIILYMYCLQARYHKPGEKYRHFSCPDSSFIQYGSDQPMYKVVWKSRFHCSTFLRYES